MAAYSDYLDSETDDWRGNCDNEWNHDDNIINVDVNLESEDTNQPQQPKIPKTRGGKKANAMKSIIDENIDKSPKSFQEPIYISDDEVKFPNKRKRNPKEDITLNNVKTNTITLKPKEDTPSNQESRKSEFNNPNTHVYNI